MVERLLMMVGYSEVRGPHHVALYQSFSDGTAHGTSTNNSNLHCQSLCLVRCVQYALQFLEEDVSHLLCETEWWQESQNIRAGTASEDMLLVEQ